MNNIDNSVGSLYPLCLEPSGRYISANHDIRPPVKPPLTQKKKKLPLV